MCTPWVVVIVVSLGCSRTVERVTAYFMVGLLGVEPRYRIRNCDTHRNSIVLQVSRAGNTRFLANPTKLITSPSFRNVLIFTNMFTVGRDQHIISWVLNSKKYPFLSPVTVQWRKGFLFCLERNIAHVIFASLHFPIV